MVTSLSQDQIDIVNKTRDAMLSGTPISTLQRITSKEQPVKGPSWVSRQTYHAPKVEGNFISSIVYNAIEALGDGSERPVDFAVEDVDVRWTGYRAGSQTDQPEVTINDSEKQKFAKLMSDVKHPVTILYFIGGGFYMNVPARYHSTTTKLAQLTGGRCLSFQYRLSPQHTFPAALIDALFTYMSLLYPAPGHFHEPIAPSSVVFAGDSAGANLALSLIQVILSTQSRGEKVQFNGRLEDLPLPGGITALSAGLDMTYALASKENIGFDIFNGEWSFHKPEFPSCPLWPSIPPRRHVYCDASLMCHPLVSPSIAKSWKGAPPIWFAGGQEVMAGSARLAAQVIAQDEGSVVYEEYAEMPHDFPIMSENWPWALTEDWPQSIRCMEHWAQTCTILSEGRNLKSKAVFISAGGEETSLDLTNLSGFSLEEAKRMMKESV
ncbi:Esterase [Lachnellula suecica]|uniref:Esterase n=1 Tax=Lachnellula suecica TaxID=602035 RepID=A0A8T9CM92_9HELO|nr:Esterase [Lachnellula suecica]